MSDGASLEPKKANDAKGSPWVLIASGLTVAYALALWFLTARARPCATENGNVLERTFNCLSANELGDYLAGAFAPVAFIWLVAAVLVQAAELREQRRELALTRKEFELNRNVAEAQVSEARKQAEHIFAQTEIMKSEWIERQTEIVEADFQRLLDTLEDVIRGSAGAIKAKLSDGSIRSGSQEFGSDRERNIQEHRKKLVVWLHALKLEALPEGLEIISVPFALSSRLQDELEVLDALLETVAKASERVKLDARLLGLEHLKGLVSSAKDLVTSFESKAETDIG
ncbi:hypothetical protein [Mesorhizobium sp. DCY119]|uniref:hypothetical protein n=1 Tax=Mesorhizobium sp. DCY119 TaxID=2108445 RepID=UPI000E6C1AF6|nr:hypothetical protein [Mesorhizobium sp. DCY119]RJG46426.1 hypothetical protein D3Y55_20735 [Mesorhizobium sp. DCY119]